MRFKIFISSVQAEFAEARRELKSFLLSDPLLKEFVSSVFVFEDEPADTQNPAGVYLDQIERSDIYIGIFGAQYGYEVPSGERSPTEKEYDAASAKGIPQWVYFFDRGDEIDPRMAALRARVDAEHKRRRVGSSVELVKQVYATFVQYLRERRILTNEPFDASIVDEATMDDIELPRLKWFFDKAVEERGFPQIVGSSSERRFSFCRTSIAWSGRARRERRRRSVMMCHSVPSRRRSSMRWRIAPISATPPSR